MRLTLLKDKIVGARRIDAKKRRTKLKPKYHVFRILHDPGAKGRSLSGGGHLSVAHDLAYRLQNT